MVRAIIIVFTIFMVGFINAADLHPVTSMFPWKKVDTYWPCTVPEFNNIPAVTEGAYCVTSSKCHQPMGLLDKEMDEWKSHVKCGVISDYRGCSDKLCCAIHTPDSTLREISRPEDNDHMIPLVKPNTTCWP